MNFGGMMKSRLLTAFWMGWLTYMVGMVLTVYDGIASLIFQPFMAAFISGVFVLASWIMGLAFRLGPLRAFWERMGAGVLVLSAVGASMLIFSSPLGLMRDGIAPDTEAPIRVMKLPALAAAYLLVIFPFANWRPRRSAEPSDGTDADLGAPRSSS